ncbi:universal stress protein [Halomarina ordinaria]|uniref:Universal stress protein n=1 Tax=Halomarina ordinaria TaxID=3033939 RepID=A0ABD5U4Z6_9EURY|nr:universal stress protein [Halomarina sp. PSRA2]
MTRHVLVAYDGSPLADRALRFATHEFPDDEVTALYVVDQERDPTAMSGWGNDPHEWEDWLEAERDLAAGLFERAERVASEEGGSVRTAAAVGRVHDRVVQYAADHDVDVVVVGTHGRSAARKALLGSVAETVIRESPVPVVAVR